MNKIKMLFIIVPLVLLVSCSTITKFEKAVYTNNYDFKPYSSRGFLITPEKWNGDYESISLIEIEIWPEVYKTKFYQPGHFYNARISNGWIYTPIRTEEILDSLYSLATEMGADALINFNVTEFIADYGIVTAPGIRASGYTIKRK